MGRPAIHGTPMTNAERQRRRRARLREIVHAEHVLADLSRAYGRAFPSDQDALRAGVKKLLRRWEKAAAAHARWWRQRLGRPVKRRRQKR